MTVHAHALQSHEASVIVPLHQFVELLKLRLPGTILGDCILCFCGHDVRRRILPV